jgi:two-component system OmpR family sensor kinase
MSVILAFLFLIKYDKGKYTAELNTKYSIIATTTLGYMQNMASAQQMKEIMETYKIEEIREEPFKSYVLNNGEVLEHIQVDIGNASIIEYEKDNYLSITPTGRYIILLKDMEFNPYKYDVMKSICAFVLIIISGVYIFTIKKIRPLNRLKKQIVKFANGDFEVPERQTGTDEISELANAFYDSVNHIKKLNHSRQLFLRNIMHELKTPITKGRITAEMLQNDEKKKQRIITAFERLEAMINEFASIERITSGIELTHVGTYRLIDIFDEAIDLAMVEKNNINFHINKDLNLNVDFKLFSLAIKNMIDNAIKYSTDKSVTITIDKNSIKFISLGEPLKRAFKYYLAPFTQDGNKAKGLGLGLYIVDNIIKAHKINFTYNYKNGKNIFSFENLETLY